MTSDEMTRSTDGAPDQPTAQPVPAPPAPAPDPPRDRRRFGCGTVLVIAVLGGIAGAAIVAVLFVAALIPVTSSTSTGDTSAPAPTEITIAGDAIGYAEAVAIKMTPSVVTVAVEQTVTDFFTGATSTEVVGTGSGVIIREDGYILTNDHVVEGADALAVLIGAEQLPATVVGRDTSSDLAVLKVDRTGLPAAEMGSSDDLRVGQPVVAIGSPFGLEQTVTTGIVSALGRTSFTEITQTQLTAYTSLIQTDAAINPGNSGGALADANGRLIGINTLIQSPSGSVGAPQSAGIGFAIPIGYARTIADELISTGRATHPFLGVSGATISAAIARQYGFPVEAGVYVQQVSTGSPAETAGIQADDIIVKIGKDDIAAVEDVFIAVRSHKVGDAVDVEVVRGSENLTLKVTLGADTATQ